MSHRYFPWLALLLFGAVLVTGCSHQSSAPSSASATGASSPPIQAAPIPQAKVAQISAMRQIARQRAQMMHSKH